RSRSTAGMGKNGHGFAVHEQPPADDSAESDAVSAPADLGGKNNHPPSLAVKFRTRRGTALHRHRETSRRSTKSLWRKRDSEIARNRPPRFLPAAKDGSWSGARLHRA